MVGTWLLHQYAKKPISLSFHEAITFYSVDTVRKGIKNLYKIVMYFHLFSLNSIANHPIVVT